MCGLAGVFSPQGPINPRGMQRVRAGLERLRHRGPDGEGLHACPSGSLVLGHRRLNVFASYNAEQPLLSHDGGIAAVVNGEFYNEAALRRDLEDDGHVFRTESDSELVIHLYETHGLDLFSHLEGEFAFLLWDRARRRLLAARDRFGVKPLAWTKVAGEVLFASEAKALFAMGASPAWSASSVAAASVHQYLPPGDTLFDGVHEVIPGTALVWSGAGNAAAEVEELKYFQFPRSEPRRVSADELVDTLRSAVHRRLRGAHRPAFALSGGLDSGSVLALARERLSSPIDAFGLQFGHVAYDESELARATARDLGCNFVAVDASRERQLQVLEDAILGSECLAINGQLPAKYLLAQTVHEHGYRVIMTGEGADELFLGYDHLRMDESAQNQAAYTPGGTDVMLASRELTAAALKRELGFEPTFLLAKLEIGRALRSLFQADIRAAVSEHDSHVRLVHSTAIQGDVPPSRQSARIWMQTALSSYILRSLGDGTEMQHSVEGRVPLLDTNVCALSQHIAPDELMSRETGKVALRRALQGIVPEAARVRPKRPLVAPPLFWTTAGQFDTRIRDRLLDSAPPFLSRSTLEHTLDGLSQIPQSEQRRAEPALFMAYCAAVLQERFNPAWSTT